MYSKVISFFTYVFLAALTLFLLFAVGVSSANAQVDLTDGNYHQFKASVGNEHHTVNVNDETFKYTIYVSDSFSPYFTEYVGTVYVANNGDIHLLRNNGRAFAVLHLTGGRFYNWSYGKDTLRSGAVRSYN